MNDDIRALVRAELDAISAYTTPKTIEARSTGLVKLDANESPWPLPSEARARIAEEVARIDLNRYPDLRATELRDAIAERIGAHPDELVIGSGSDEVIAILLTALSAPRPGRARPAILFPVPTFVMFRLNALAHGHEPIEVPLASDWSLDVAAMRTAIAASPPNLIFLATPNNPTGNAFADRDLEGVIDAAGGRALVVLDEAYAWFAGRSLSSWCDRSPAIGALGTLSKVGLAGLRVGWARLDRELAREVDKARQPYNVSAVSQRIATLVMRELWHVVEQQVAAIVAERERLGAALRAIGTDALEVSPSAANFFFVRSRGGGADGGDAGALARELAARGVLVRSFHAAGGRLSGWMRITVGTPADNDRLVETLRALV